MWNWSQGDNVVPSVHQNRSSTAYNSTTLPPARQTASAALGYTQYQGYIPQSQTASNFFYGYQGTFQPRYASFTNTHNVNPNPYPAYEPQFVLKSRKNPAVSEVRKSDKSLKRKSPKQTHKPPIIKRKDKRLTSGSQTSSSFQVTPSESPSPRSASPSSGDIHFGSPDLAHESVLGRASILVVDDYRGNQSIGSRSAKSRASTATLREYRPSHIPDPVVPGFSFSSDEEDTKPHKLNNSGSDNGRGYAKSIETYSLNTRSRHSSTSSDDQTDAPNLPPPFIPPPPVVLATQPLYATVNKDTKSSRPDKEDPIYFTIDEAKKHLTGKTEASDLPKDSSVRSKPLTVLDELKERFSLRSKSKVLEFVDKSDLPGQSSSHQSAFRPYNALKSGTYKMDDQSHAEYDAPIPIDKVLLKDGSEPSELQVPDIEKDTGEETARDTRETPALSGKAEDTNSRLSGKVEDPADVITPSKADIYHDKANPPDAPNVYHEIPRELTEEQKSTSNEVVGSSDIEDKFKDISTDGSIRKNGFVPLPALPPIPPATQDQASHISSSVVTQSNMTYQSSTKSSQLPVLHEPIIAPDFKPKGILKNKNGRESSSESSSDEEIEEEEKSSVTKNDNDKYHMTIPVDVSEKSADAETASKDLLAVPTAKGKDKFTPPSSLRSARKSESNSSLPNSLRAARKASLSSGGGSGRRQFGVSFTSDTRDNEGVAKKYEKEGFDMGKTSKEDIATKPNLLDMWEDEKISKPVIEPPAPVHEVKQRPPSPIPVPVPELEPMKQPEQFKQPESIKQPDIPKQAQPKVEEPTTTDLKPTTKDQSVSTDMDPQDIVISTNIQTKNSPTITPAPPKKQQQDIDPPKRDDYAIVMKSPRGILKHPNGTATLQLNQRNQFIISTPDKCATLPNGSLKINTDLTGARRGGGYSPNYKLANQSPSYTVRQTGDNISVVSITGYDPAWETRSNYSTDTIRTLDDYHTGTVRTMVSLGSYSNPYAGNELVANGYPYQRQISDSSTDPLAFSMSFDSQMFEYRMQQKQNGIQQSKPHRKHHISAKKAEAEKPPLKDSGKSVQKKTTFALSKEELLRKEKKKKRKQRCIKIIAMLSVLAVVILIVALVIYFLTDKDNQQNDSQDE